MHPKILMTSASSHNLQAKMLGARRDPPGRIAILECLVFLGGFEEIDVTREPAGQTMKRNGG